MYFDRYFPRLWDSFNQMHRVLDEFDRASGWLDRGWPAGAEYPALNLWSSDDGLALSAEVPGLDPDSLEISVVGDTLTLKGRRPAQAPEDATALRRERGELSFTRSVQLPYPVDPDQCEARYRNGVLQIALQRRAEDKPRRIRVEAA